MSIKRNADAAMQILREKVAGNIEAIFDALKSPMRWLRYFLSYMKKG